ncbi:MAG: hypothetical protein GX158_11045 [Bacteroidales bacterium]|jgi:hypothetical protein|nr:hypothetical protein [Bacteroidales bacterium]
MKRACYLLILLLSVSLTGTKARANKADAGLILENLYDRITASVDDDEKLRLNDSVRIILGAYAESDSVFVHSFENLRYLGQITSPDRKLKIITWNVFLRNSPNRYFCYIIRKEGRKMPNTVFSLSGMNREEPVRDDIIYTSDNWYGALYYSIQPFRNNRQLCYLVLGLDYGNMKVSRKIIDVLTFSPDDSLVFGLDCFIREEGRKLREVLEYSPEGIISLRMENNKTVVFDEPVTVITGHGDGYELTAAGVSFSGYVRQRGNWKFVSGIDVKNKKKK